MAAAERAPEKAKAEYEAAWGRLDSWIEQCIRDGMTDPAQIARTVTRSECGQSLGATAFQDYYRSHRADRPDQRLGVAQGAYKLLPFDFRDPDTLDTLVKFVQEHRSGIDTIVELGSGIGRNLFMLSERLQRDGAGPLAFHACEYTEAGRRATARLDTIGGRKLLSVHPFDYRHPDLSFLDGSQNTLFFTVFSLEQVSTVTDAFINEMLSRTAACHCIHFEPVGWQFDPELVEWRERIDQRGAPEKDSLWWRARRVLDALLGTRGAPGFSFIPLRDVVIGASDKTSLNAARWSARFRYNKNLVEVLHRMQHERKIDIFREEANVFAPNPFNPAAILGWSKRS